MRTAVRILLLVVLANGYASNVLPLDAYAQFIVRATAAMVPDENVPAVRDRVLVSAAALALHTTVSPGIKPIWGWITSHLLGVGIVALCAIPLAVFFIPGGPGVLAAAAGVVTSAAKVVLGGARRALDAIGKVIPGKYDRVRATREALMITWLPVSLLGPFLLGAGAPRLPAPQVLEREVPAVVEISAIRPNGQISRATGFVVKANGVIVTSFRVVAGAHSAAVRFDTEVHVHVSVLNYDQSRDIAILKIDEQKLPTVTLGDSQLPQPGDAVFVIANSDGKYAVVHGTVIAKRMVDDTECIDTTIPLGPATSGGPLYKLDGRVVGMTTISKKDGFMLNCAVPLKHVVPLLEATQPISLAQFASQTAPKSDPEAIQKQGTTPRGNDRAP